MKTFGCLRQNRLSMLPCVCGQTPTWKAGCKLWKVESMASVEQRVRRIEERLESRAIGDDRDRADKPVIIYDPNADESVLHADDGRVRICIPDNGRDAHPMP